MAKDPIIQQAIRELKSYFDMEVDDDPYRIYQMLEDRKNEVAETYQLLAIQERCLDLICRDLSEHGKDNLFFYAQGKYSEQHFHDLHVAIVAALLAELKRTGAKTTDIWEIFGRIPLKFQTALNSED